MYKNSLVERVLYYLKEQVRDMTRTQHLREQTKNYRAGWRAELRKLILRLLSPSRRKHKLTQKSWQNVDKLYNQFAYMAPIVYVRFFSKKGASLLDVGCGKGQLLKYLDLSYHDLYAGVDISREAIRSAHAGNKKNNVFMVICDAEKIPLNYKFDIIAFIESLFYFEDPIKTLQKFESMLKKDGVFIISMTKKYMNVQLELIWSEIFSRYSLLDEVEVTRQTLPILGWKCAAVKPVN